MVDLSGAGENIEQKKEVANNIFEKLKNTQSMIWKLKLNIFWGWIKDYLVSEGIGDTINDGMKWFLLSSVLKDKGDFTIDNKKYSSVFEFLEAAKKAITNATQADLANLKNKIDLWLPEQQSNTNNETNDTRKQEHLHNNPEVNKIVESLETKGQLTAIKEVKDSKWNSIMECSWKTPYFNENAIWDLVNFALTFYKKTWKALKISSAYRTISYQEELQAENKNKTYTDNHWVQHTWVPTATPWLSNHQTGHAIDIASDSRTLLSTTEFLAITKANNFKRDKNEPWHFNHKNMVTRKNRLAISTKLNNNYEKYRA